MNIFNCYGKNNVYLQHIPKVYLTVLEHEFAVDGYRHDYARRSALVQLDGGELLGAGGRGLQALHMLLLTVLRRNDDFGKVFRR